MAYGTEELYGYCKENFALSIADEDDNIMELADRDRYCVFMVSDENGEDAAYVKVGNSRILHTDGTEITGILPDSVIRDVIDVICIDDSGKVIHD